MHRYLMAAVGAALIAGCQAVETLRTEPANRGVYAAATLATVGTFEYDAAPAYTRNTLVRRRAAASLEARRITVDVARVVLDRTDRARATLDRAVAADRQQAPIAARELLDRARVEIDAAAAYLQENRR